MFRKHFSIQIDNPCHENWENMLPAEQGRFCNSCSKQVVDFTQMSDTDIIKYFKTHHNVCGHFYEDQLQHNLLPYTQKQSLFRKVVAAVVLLFQTFLSEAQTQNNKPQSIVIQEESTNDSISPVCSNKIPGDSGFFKTSLLVIDHEDKSTIFNASIVIDGDTLECKTSADGKLTFELPLKYKDSTVKLKVIKDDYIVYYHDMLLDGDLFIIMLIKKTARTRHTLGGAVTTVRSCTEKQRNRSNDLYRKYPGLFRDF